MKINNSFILGLLFLVLIQFTSCTNPSKVLPSKDGKWDFSWVSSSSSSVATATGTMTFSEDGSGTMEITSPSSGSSPFTWSYDKSGKTLKWSSGMSEIIFEVKEAKPKSEKWHMTTTNPVGSLDVTLTR